MDEEITTQEKLKIVQDQIEEMKDTQTVNKLDIINLNNEVDSLKLTSNQLTPETQKKMEEIIKITQKVDKFKKLDDLVKDVSDIKRKGIGSPSKPGYTATKEMTGLQVKLNQLEQSMNILETKLSSLKPVRIPESAPTETNQEELQEIYDKLEKLEARSADVISLKQKLSEIQTSPSAPAPSGKITISQVNGLEDFMYSKFREMTDLIKDGIDRNAKSIQMLQDQLEIINRKFEELDRLKDIVKQLDMDQVRREFEKVKVKSEYLEEQLEKMDLSVLREKINEIEHRLSMTHTTSPVVIE